MECPFLRDVKVKYCEASPFRKMILDGRSAGSERCISPAYAECPAFDAASDQKRPSPTCPFLHEARAEYCSASPVTKFIPAAPALLSRCNSDGHLYCELYLSHADPTGSRFPAKTIHASGGEAEPIPAPDHLFYAPNHMWIDIAADGVCHIGIDAFLGHVTDSVEKITFLPLRNGDAPAVVLTMGGADLLLSFPRPLNVVAANYYLRTDPAKLLRDPYGGGWLFEALEPAAVGTRRASAIREGLIPGERASVWMQSELDRLATWTHGRLADEGGHAVMADGGRATPSVAAQLERGELINLFNEFFPPVSGWRRTW